MTALTLVLALLALAVAVGESTYATRQRRAARRATGVAADQLDDAPQALPVPAPATTSKPGALGSVSLPRVVDTSSVGGDAAPSSPPTDRPSSSGDACPVCTDMAARQAIYRGHVHAIKHAAPAAS
ncbi:hypothetical protein [Cellulomonas palmilytica]|uniref:hypothetical protein n=1 Tax=Cellulomonas palmilytica TaxID=2608402 RepID=UPI001F25076F|nr:hypothetical protein [Cellulomonas palmilytica]UJP39361.1 hypothetical protein F1D97_13600 [Cellulomonas palmilytica]